MWGNIVENYNTLINDHSDKRVEDWFLMRSVSPTLALCLAYALIVKVAGPRFMRDRKPFQLRNTLIVYNLVQVLISTYLFYEIWDAAWGNGYSLRCEPVDYSTSPNAVRIARTVWLFYLSKFTEFLDTFFFVLRKKHDQVSTLHVIHHGITPISVWFAVKFTPGGHSTFCGFLNTFVHIVMYAYYMLAAIGPHMQKYLWWKKYLTRLQMVQFVMIFVHGVQLLFIDCDYPNEFAWLILMHAVMFFGLFSHFYRRSYKKKDDRQKDVAHKKKDDDAADVDDNRRRPPKDNDKPFWASLLTPSCFLPAVTDPDSGGVESCSSNGAASAYNNVSQPGGR